MTFNHYARLKQIIDAREGDWMIVRIDEPTTAARFDGTKRTFDHYYRLYDLSGQPLKYGKFQQIDKLAHILQCDVHELPIVESNNIQIT